MSRIPQLRGELVQAAARRYQPAAEPGRALAKGGTWLHVGHHHRRRWLALAGGAVAAGLAAAGLFGFQGGGFAPTSAVAAMDGLAQIAAAQDWPGVPGPGQYFYTDSTLFTHSYITRDAYGGFGSRGYPLGSGPHCAVDQTTHVQHWMAADGSGAETDTGYDYRFGSAADQAACATIGVTDPHVPRPGLNPKVEDSKIEQPHTNFFSSTPPGGAYTPGIGGELPFGGDDWKTLSSDPATLLRQLRQDDHGWNTDNTPAGEFHAVADFMSESDAPPAVRGKVFRAAKLIQGIKLMGTQTDPTGQTGIGVAVDHIYGNGHAVEGVREELIFDPRTARLLTTEFILDKNDRVVSWESYKQPKLVDSAPTDTSRTAAPSTTTPTTASTPTTSANPTTRTTRTTRTKSTHP